MAAILYSNKYEIQKEIAQGGMGVVYQAWDHMLERVVALKVIHQNLANDSNFLDRFLDEARKMAHLHHPNIIQIYSVEKDHNIPFLVMEYFPGANLKTHLCQNTPLGIRESVHIVSKIAHALTFTHKKGIIHRDIKPANILLDDTLTVKLTDFGISKAFGQTSHTATGQLLGTVKYMSPEQARDIPLDGRSDLYSLGMLFYEFVTGTNPRNDLTAVGILSMLITEGHMPSLSFPASLNIPLEIQQTIFDLLQFCPTDRIPNAETLIERLEQSFPGGRTPMTTFETEHTNETITMGVGESLKSVANEPSLSKSSASLPNLPAKQPERTPPNESSPQIFSSSRSGLLVATISLILVIGGFAWNYLRSSQPPLLLDNQIARRTNMKNFQEEKATPLLTDANTTTNHEKLPEEFDAPIQKSTTSLSAQKPQLSKIHHDPPEPSLPLPNLPKEKIISEGDFSKSVQLAHSPSPPDALPIETSHQGRESQAGPQLDIVSSLQVQSDASPTLAQVPIPPLASSSDLNPSEPSPIALAKPALSIENIEEDSGTIPSQTTQVLMRSSLHFQVEQLQQAIIEKNWEALERMSSMSESRRSWLETLYTKYKSVQIDIAQVVTEDTEGQAIIHFTKGIRFNGEVVIPNQIGRTIKITIPKNGDQWGRIIW